MYQLTVGFDQSVPEQEAARAATAEWYEAVSRTGATPDGAPTTRVVRDDPERTALGEYVVVAEGRRYGEES